MRVPFVALERQNIALSQELISAFGKVLVSGRYLFGSELDAFEREAAAAIGVPYVVGLASGTDACEVAMRATFPRGARVSTPAFGAVPTINAIVAAGLEPVLTDVDPVTRGVSAETLARVQVDGHVVVHMFGQPCYVPTGAIEDCAHAQGATILGEQVGTWGAAGAFSAFPTKCLGTMGDGGWIATKDEALAKRARAIRHYGFTNDRADVQGDGINSRLCELQAALLRVKLPYLDIWNERRRRIAVRYTSELAGKVTTPREYTGLISVYHVYVVEHPERDRIKAGLEERGIGCMVHYPKALHEYSRWSHLGARGDFPVSERLARTVLSLPMHPDLTEAEQDAVIGAVKELT